MHRIHVVFGHGVEVAGERVPVPQVQQTVGHLLGVFRHLRAVVAGRVAFHHGQQLGLHLDTAAFEAVYYEAQGVHAGPEPFVLGAEFPSGRSAEPSAGALGVQLQAGERQKQEYYDFSHSQKLKPMRSPMAGVPGEALKANCLPSGIMTVGDMSIDRSSVTSKLCM